MVDECHGHRLHSPSDGGIMVYPESGWHYEEVETGVLRYLDWLEDEALPATEKDRGAGERGAEEQGSGGAGGQRGRGAEKQR
jgi:hypothetical protein